MSYADQMLIRQVLLDEAQGNVTTALELACARLATAYRGVSFGHMRWGANGGDGVLPSDPPPVDDGSWLVTGRERNA